jgi:hypothetical protein
MQPRSWSSVLTLGYPIDISGAARNTDSAHPPCGATVSAAAPRHVTEPYTVSLAPAGPGWSAAHRSDKHEDQSGERFVPSVPALKKRGREAGSRTEDATEGAAGSDCSGALGARDKIDPVLLGNDRRRRGRQEIWPRRSFLRLPCVPRDGAQVQPGVRCRLAIRRQCTATTSTMTQVSRYG